MTIKPTSVPTKRLNKTISSTATSFSLVDITGWDSNDLTSSDFGSILYAVFRNSTDTIMEIMEIDATTIADSNITINKRGLKFDGDLTTEVVANKLSWIRGDTIVEIGTDAPQLFNSYVDLNSTQTITGMKSVPTPTASEHIANMQYVLDIAAGVPVSFDRTTVAGTAGETITTGQAVYFDTVTNNEWMLADASTVAKVENVLIGIAQGAGTNGTTISGGIVLFGLDSNQTGMTVGDIMYISDTAGTISSTPGTKEVTIGIAKSATEIYFNPRFNQELTEDEQDALVGTQGQPSSTNKYVTDDNVYSDEFDQTQTTQDALVSFGEDDATTKKNLIAQSFKPSRTKISGVKLDKQTDTGTFTGTVTVSIQSDTSGKPDGTDLATKTLTNAEWLLLLTGEFEIEFSSEYDSLVEGDSYWIVATSSTSDASNHPNLGTNSVGGYSDGSTMYKNVTDDWVAIANIDLYFKTINGLENQILKRTSNGGLPFKTSNLPIAAFQQQIPTMWLTIGTDNRYSTGSSSDGSAFYLNFANSGSGNHLIRFERDSITGQYIQTHDFNLSYGNLIGDFGGIIQIDTYIYLFNSDGTNVRATRYLASDLTGQQVMTVPTLACTNFLSVWTDGTNAYLVSYSDDVTSHKWTVSGTTFSASSTATVTTGIFAKASSAMLFDGTNAYLLNGSTIITFYKLEVIDGSTLSPATTIFNDGIVNNLYEQAYFMMNIDSERIYYGRLRSYNSAASDGVSYLLAINPITKPV